MTNLEIIVHVNLDVTPNLVAFVNAILHKETQPAEIAASLEPSPEEEAQTAITPARKQRKIKTEQVAQDVAKDNVPAEEAPEPESQAEEQKELTEEDVRSAMHRARTRIEGEDYKENTDGEKYQKYHKQLTAQFKNISAVLGAEKPSALAADKRESFICQCDELIIGKDGSICVKQAF